MSFACETRACGGRVAASVLYDAQHSLRRSLFYRKIHRNCL